MKSTLFNMVMVLFVITLLASRRRGSGPYDYRGADCRGTGQGDPARRSNRCCPSSTKRRIRH